MVTIGEGTTTAKIRGTSTSEEELIREATEEAMAIGPISAETDLIANASNAADEDICLTPVTNATNDSSPSVKDRLKLHSDF